MIHAILLFGTDFTLLLLLHFGIALTFVRVRPLTHSDSLPRVPDLLPLRECVLWMGKVLGSGVRAAFSPLVFSSILFVSHNLPGPWHEKVPHLWIGSGALGCKWGWRHV